MFYCELTFKEVVVLYLYLRIVFGDGGGVAMFGLLIVYREVFVVMFVLRIIWKEGW